ncbi:MAG: NFACT family protein, partial [Chloroflexi bacterium]|nr:NFACT family protein [Chloroflexota bacterium]
MHAVRDELAATILGGRVEHVFLLGTHGLGLHLYAQRQKRSLLLSADPAAARVHLTSAPLKRGSDAVTPLLLLLRKYVRDGWVEAVEQPRLERLLTLRIASRSDEGTVRRVGLIIEAMGRRSNIVLVDEDGAILDALRRTPPSRNPIRPVLPHLRYTPPPAQERLDPLADSTVARLRDEALQARAAPRLADLLGQRLAGFSPQLAREAAWRAAGALDALANEATDWRALRVALDELLQPLGDGSWQPTVAWHDGRPVACAPYPLTHLQDVELRPAASMSEALVGFWIADCGLRIGD